MTNVDTVVKCACGCQPEVVVNDDKVAVVVCPRCGDSYRDHEWASGKHFRQRWAERQAFRRLNAVSKIKSGYSAIRRCEDCVELPDDGTCDKCGDSVLTTKDAFVSSVGI